VEAEVKAEVESEVEAGKGAEAEAVVNPQSAESIPS